MGAAQESISFDKRQLSRAERQQKTEYHAFSSPNLDTRRLSNAGHSMRINRDGFVYAGDQETGYQPCEPRRASLDVFRWLSSMWTQVRIIACCRSIFLNTAVVSFGLAYTRSYSRAVNRENPLVGINRINWFRPLTNRFDCSKVFLLLLHRKYDLDGHKTPPNSSACCHVPLSIFSPTQFRPLYSLQG